MYDVVIVGAGISGCFIARDLSRYQLSVAVVEKANDVANGATMANSAIVHSGHDPKPGTLKAKLNVEGNRMYEDICKELHVDFQRVGAYVVASCEEQLPHLEELYNQAKERNVPVEYVEREELFASEPNITKSAVRAISLPSTGIIYPWEVAIALMENAIENGVELFLNEEVKSIDKKDSSYVVHTSTKELEAKVVINCAGVYADEIYKMVSDNVGFEITPRKGEYFVLDHTNKPLVNRVIYPLPSAKGKGVLVVPTTHGNILLGPNSDVINDKSAINNTKEALDYVKRELPNIVENIPMGQVIRNFAGLRPTGTTGDFIIEEAKDAKNFVNVAAIESPGLASAPAISKYVIDTIVSNLIDLKEKDNFKSERAPYVDLKKLSIEERNELVKKDPRFARIVCRCEQITEGEIVAAIHRPCGATTVKGVKKRIRPGMGRCQGGFCEPLVVDILSRELGKSKMEICLDSPESKLFVQKTKE